MAKVFELKIPSTDKLVLLAMADHARDDGTGCYPSVGTLARKTSQTTRGVQKIMRRLESAGLIVASRISRGYHTTEYRLTLEHPEPRSLFSVAQYREHDSSKPRTSGSRTPNVVMKYPEQGSPEPSGTVREPSAKLETQKHAKIPFPDRNIAIPTAFTRSRAKYAIVGKMLSEATEILARAKRIGKPHADGDCREELKQWAAARGIPYRQDAISKAFDVAEARARDYGHTQGVGA